MAIDVYGPCPCGSGKKLKFCCAAIFDEMIKVLRLLSAEQPRQALQLIEKLDKAHPENPWVATTHAEILLNLNDQRAAKERLESLLKVQPDHVGALAARASAMLLGEGFDAARPAVYRALQKGVSRQPQTVALLTLTIATIMQHTGHMMAARHFLSVALRLTEDEEERQEIFVLLLKLDGDATIAYPMRSVHNLIPYPSAGKHAAEAGKAAALASIGCCGPAERAWTRIAELEPQNASLWHNAGLCRAWDADETSAGEAFHRAAAASDDFALAVEYETLAQLCDRISTRDVVPLSRLGFPLRSASRLLGLLEGHDRIGAAGLPNNEDEEEAPLAGRFVIRDRPLAPESDLGRLTIDQIPLVTARLDVYDSLEGERDASAVLTGFAGESFQQARTIFENVAQEELSGPAIEHPDDLDDAVPREELPFVRMWQFPAQLPMAARQALSADQWSRLVNDVWMNDKQAGLGGKTPLDAQGNAEEHVRLTASVYVLDSLAQRLGRTLDLDSVLRRLELDPLPLLEPTPDIPLTSLSPMQLHRLPVSRLSDSQLMHAHRRAVLIGHRRFVKEVLEEVLARPQVASQVDVDRVYRSLVNVARDAGRLPDAIALTLQAKEHASKQPNAFELVLSWTISEFWLRAEQLDDPELPNIYRHLAEYYAPKVPQITGLLDLFRQQYADRFPWLRTSEMLVGSAAAGETTPGGIWTPGAADAPPSGGGKLWLPGQE